MLDVFYMLPRSRSCETEVCVCVCVKTSTFHLTASNQVMSDLAPVCDCLPTCVCACVCRNALQADFIGLVLAARACFNITNAQQVWLRLVQHEAFQLAAAEGENA